MNASIEVTIFHDGLVAYQERLDTAAEFGRQFVGELPPYGQHVKAAVTRVVIAPLEELAVPRRLFHVEALATGQARLTNLSRSPLALDRGARLRTGCTREVGLPFTVLVGNRSFFLHQPRVAPTPAPQDATRSLAIEQATVAGGRTDANCGATLDELSTYWPLIHDPHQFVHRYAPAIRRYLEALLHNVHDAEDVAQDFLLKGIVRGFVRGEAVRGRFRAYLKTAVRNAALTYLQRRRPGHLDGPVLAQVADRHDSEAEAEAAWLAEWRRCLIEHALDALDRHQQQTPGNLFATAIRLVLDHPDDDSTRLAARASALVGRPVRAEAFRKQLSRARRCFADLLIREVARSLEAPTPAQIEDELNAIGVLPLVRAFLPDGTIVLATPAQAK
jgi:RNA polymerase sigma factor (sigma-70 family)